jgi:hypothetical protein
VGRGRIESMRLRAHPNTLNTGGLLGEFFVLTEFFEYGMIKMMDIAPSTHLPDKNRLSVVVATVMLAYAVTPFIVLPPRILEVQLPGIYLSFTLNFATLTSVLAAALAGVGTEWLLHLHPRYSESREGRHWILPTLTAWVIGVPLNNLEVGPEWWAVFAFGGLLLSGVCAAEYIAADPADPRHAPITAALTAVSFALFLVLAVGLRGAGLRLFLILPALFLAVFLAALRTLYLRLEERWVWTWPAAISFVVCQVAAGLHYWPLTPLQFGLILIGPAYALTGIAVTVEEGRPLRSQLAEPVLVLISVWVLAVLVRG